MAFRTPGGDYLASAEVFDLLVAVPKIGPVKAAHLLTSARISPSKTVAGLSERQRARLIVLLSRSLGLPRECPRRPCEAGALAGADA